MCGCEKHNDESAPCTCICDSHRNFEAARDLAVQRYHAIVEVEAERDAARQKLEAIEQVLADDWLHGRILPAYLGAENAARMGAIRRIVLGPDADAEKPVDPPQAEPDESLPPPLFD